MKTIHMKNEITSDMIEKLEILAQLELTEAERQQAVGNLNQIVDYFSQIGKVQTNGSDDQVVTERTGTCGNNFGG